MKILFLLHRIPWPVKDGGAVANYNMLLGLTRAGCEVKLLCLDPEKEKTDRLHLPPVFTRCSAEYFALDTSVKPLAALQNVVLRDSYYTSRFYHKPFLDRALALLKQEHFDLVHLEGIFAGTYARKIREKTGVPCVLRTHNVEYRIWQSLARQTINPLKAMYLHELARTLKREEKRQWDAVQLIAAITAEDAAYIAGQTKTPVFNGSMGIPLPEVQGTEPLKGSFFHLAAMDWRPNQEAVSWLLEAIWPEIYNTLPGSSLYLAGKNMPAHFLHRKTMGLHVEGTVENAYEWMARREIMLVPLRSGSGIRVKIIEAMALGKVVIATSTALSGLGARSGVEVLEANTVKEFVDQASFLMEKEERMQKISEAARTFVHREFEIEAVTNRLLGHYKTLLHEPSA